MRIGISRTYSPPRKGKLELLSRTTSGTSIVAFGTSVLLKIVHFLGVVGVLGAIATYMAFGDPVAKYRY